MKTYDELANRWNSCQGGQILVDYLHPIKMYLNINENGNRELLIPVSKPVVKFQSTEAIGVRNYKNADTYYFAIELLSENLVKEYVCLCFDLIESSKRYTDREESLKVLFSTFKKWYSLMAAVRADILPIKEIRGLMGEVKFMIDELSLGKYEDSVIGAWTTHKDACRDFIYDNTWNEIKTVKSSSEYITISSLEQLDHDMNGHLVVYKMDLVTKEGDGTYTLNGIIDDLRGRLSLTNESELSLKLLSKGYTYNEQYNQYIFAFAGRDRYVVNDLFPRISKEMISSAISSAKYDILLNKIVNWREKDE